MTGKLSIRPGDQLRAALAIDAERARQSVAGLAVSILAAHYGQQPPEVYRGLASQPAEERARVAAMGGAAKAKRRPKIAGRRKRP